MKCPHCLVEVHVKEKTELICQDRDGAWGTQYWTCPNPKCERATIHLLKGKFSGYPTPQFVSEETVSMIRPRSANRIVPAEVPKETAKDFNEANLVLADSPTASAALSRRCLQSVLRNAGGVIHGDLADEIAQVIGSGKLPSSLSEGLEMVRQVGNYAAHPNKSKRTGELVEVEPHEAQFNLDVLEQLFDFYYVLPAKTEARLKAFRKKMQEAKSPPHPANRLDEAGSIWKRRRI